ncbi:MAG: hypothetical protein KatS3mg130_1027 [Candidatus Sumerlaea sp.]|nr:MAG: hypothetical protein KatS3mg130_1027 [Candidatus Sumerlaea sp.]
MRRLNPFQTNVNDCMYVSMDNPCLRVGLANGDWREGHVVANSQVTRRGAGSYRKGS